VNRFYRHIWSKALGRVIVVPECARGGGGKKGGRRRRVAHFPAACALSLVVAGVAVPGWAVDLDTDRTENGTAWNVGNDLNIGVAANGTLTITNGGQVNDTLGLAGYNTGFTGEVTVSGPGSVWTNSSNVAIGYEGHGVLTVEDEATVTNVDGYVGDRLNSSGTATITGANSSWNNSGYLTIGNYGDGELTVSNGGDITNANSGYVGRRTDSVGVVTVTGSGSTWTNSDALAIGFEGNGTLNVEAGGHVHSVNNTLIGDQDTSVSTATVTGAGSTLSSDAAVIVGQLGEGTLTVENGGLVTADALIAGHLGGSDGTINVVGPNAQVNSASLLRIGDDGTGALLVSGGGVVTNTSNGFVGAATGGRGTATVTGSGSQFNNSGTLYVGGQYNDTVGVLTLTDDGTVAVGGGAGTLRIADHSGATGTLNIGSVSGDAAAAAGTLNAAAVSFGSGIGRIVLNHNENAYSFAANISGGGSVLVESGVTALTGTNTYSGGTTVSDGTLRAGGASALAGGAFTVTGGTLDLNDFDLSMSELSGTGGTVDLGGATLTVGSGNTDTAFAGAIEGTGSIEKTGTGKLTLTGANSYSGGTMISGGTLEGTASSLTGDIVNNATLAFAQAGDGTFAGAVTGTGGVEKTGAGKLTLTGANGYTGGTTVSGGTLEGTASSLTGDIVNNAILAFAQAADGTFAGAVSGTGGVEKTGAGKLTLSGANSYTGGTTVSGGTLAGDTSSLQGDIVNNASLLFDQSADGTYAGVLSGNGDIVKSGAGSLVLSGISGAFTGGLEVLSGSLVVDGTFGGGLLVSGGFLGGSGTVGATTLGAGATVAPGNSIGALSVAGDFAFGAGSIYEVEVNDGGNTPGVNNDFIDIAGALTIDSGAVVEVVPENGTDDGASYAPSTTYTILTADGGISGVFGGVTAGFAFLTPELSYDTTSVFLTLTQMAAFEDVASTPNQQGVAAATEALGAGNLLYDEIIVMSEEDAQAAFDALSGEAHASSTGVFSGSAGIVRRTIFSRLFSRFGAPRGFAAAQGYVPAAGDETPHGYTLWGELVRGWGETDGSASVAGIERHSTGFLGGVDREIGEASRIGFALGYSRSDFDVSGRSSSGESDNVHLAGYAGTELGSVDLKAVLGYSYQMAESRRRVVVGSVVNDLSADYGAHTFQASGEASVDLEAGSVTLTPFAGLAVVHVETEAFTETGGPSALSISSSGNTTGTSELGLRAAREAGSLTLFGSASWRHVFGDVEPLSRAAFASSPATTFSVRGTPLSEDVASLGGGVELLIAEETTLELSYRGEFASDSRDHGLKAKVSIRF